MIAEVEAASWLVAALAFLFSIPRVLQAWAAVEREREREGYVSREWLDRRQ